MYFRESAIIVSNKNFVEEDVAAIDEYLHANQGQPVRVGRISDFTGVKQGLAESILDCFLAAGVVTQASLALCVKCDSLIEDTDPDGQFECDLCERRYDPENVPYETVYLPRATQFECGDDIPLAHAGVPDVDGIEKIIGCSDDDRVADIVFVHGLDGDAMSTWHPKDRPDAFWPKWIGETFPAAGVWSLGYKANSIGLTGTAMALTDRATNILAMFEAAGIGGRPVIFIVHSLGGLVVKQLLRHACDFGNADWKRIALNTKGIAFLATPHAGSDLASYIKYLGKLLRTTVAVDELKAHDASLRQLNLWFRNNCADMGIRIIVLFETQPTYGVTVVDPTSSDPGILGVIPIPIDADHISICKPTSKSHPVFAQVKLFIGKVIGQ
jgi:pimeloyl-ACP methyl ester carboxylesterase